MDVASQTPPGTPGERIRQLELKVEAMAKEPDNLRAELRAAILESEGRMKDYVDKRFDRFTDYVDQRFSRLETRVDVHFGILITMQAVMVAGIIGVAVRLLFMA